MSSAARTSPLRSPGQNSRIWALVGALSRASGLDRDELRPMLDEACRQASGQEHTSRLTTTQAAGVIARLERELASYERPAASPTPAASPAPHVPWGPRQAGPRGSLGMTAFQARVIAGLFQLVGYDIRRQRSFSQRQTGKPWPETQGEADALITPLSAMSLRHVDVADVRARVRSMVGNPALDRWKTGFVADLDRQFDEAADASRVLSPHKLIKVLECEAACGGAS